MPKMIAPMAEVDLYEKPRLPYRFENISSYPNKSVLVLAAFALTMCRWADKMEVTVVVICNNFDDTKVRRVFQVKIDDRKSVHEFLQTVENLKDVEVTDEPTDDGNIDLVIVSDLVDMRSGEVRLLEEIPDAQGFITDVAAAVEGLATVNGLLENLRCIAPDRRQILDEMVGVDVAICDIAALFLEQVQKRPQQLAVRDAGLELTFEQLSQAANDYAIVLMRAGVGPGDRVLVAVRPSVREVVALLAIVRLGAVYSGFVEDDPEARTILMINKLVPAVTIVDSAMSDHPALRNVSRVEAWNPEMTLSTDSNPVFSPLGPTAANSAVFVSFTSGTTGDPKGVVITQKAVTRLALSPELRIYPDDRVMRMAPLTFDTSQFEIWGTLLNGATLEVFPSRFPQVGKLEAFFNEQRISVAWLTAGLFRLIANSRPEAFSRIRWIVTGGEVVPHDSVARMLDMHSGLTITNGYGPTENTTFTTTYTVSSSAEVNGPLPIGRPIAGTTIYVLDRNFRLVPPGAVGELFTGGSGVADGYLNDVLQTKSKFDHFCPDIDERLYRTGDLVRINADGNVLFLGRADKQIKLNSYRIELEEISSILARHPDVRDAVIVVSQQTGNETRLVAAVTAQPGATPVTRLLREYLSGFLPSYAIPPLWVVVDEIPITRNGKVDERSLIDAAQPIVRAEEDMR